MSPKESIPTTVLPPARPTPQQKAKELAPLAEKAIAKSEMDASMIAPDARLTVSVRPDQLYWLKEQVMEYNFSKPKNKITQSTLVQLALDLLKKTDVKARLRSEEV